MKVRSLRQVLHWSFLIVGLLSMMLLALSVKTYLGYVEEGYGLDCRLDHAALDGDCLILRLDIENPGGLDIILEGGSLTVGRQYDILTVELPNGDSQQLPLSDLPKGENTAVMIWFQLNDYDLSNLTGPGSTSITLDLEIFVPERDLWTHLVCVMDLEGLE